MYSNSGPTTVIGLVLVLMIGLIHSSVIRRTRDTCTDEYGRPCTCTYSILYQKQIKYVLPPPPNPKFIPLSIRQTFYFNNTDDDCHYLHVDYDEQTGLCQSDIPHFLNVSLIKVKPGRQASVTVLKLKNIKDHLNSYWQELQATTNVPAHNSEDDLAGAVTCDEDKMKKVLPLLPDLITESKRKQGYKRTCAEDNGYFYACFYVFKMIQNSTGRTPKRPHGPPPPPPPLPSNTPELPGGLPPDPPDPARLLALPLGLGLGLGLLLLIIITIIIILVVCFVCRRERRKTSQTQPPSNDPDPPQTPSVIPSRNNTVVYAEARRTTTGGPLQPSAPRHESPPSYNSSVNFNRGGSVGYTTLNNGSVNRFRGETDDYATPCDYRSDCDPGSRAVSSRSGVAPNVQSDASDAVIVDNNLYSTNRDGVTRGQ